MSYRSPARWPQMSFQTLVLATIATLGLSGCDAGDEAPPLADDATAPDVLVRPEIPESDVEGPALDAANRGETDQDVGTLRDAVAGPEDVVDPIAAGAWAVSQSSIQVPGISGESFDALLFVPEGQEPVPAVVFLPGFMLGGEQFASTGQHIASHGFLVLVPSFGDSVLAPIDHADLASHVSAMLDWLQAESGLPDGALTGRLKVGPVGTAGHSRGGKAALLTAIQDARVGAVYTMDPVDSAGGPLGGQPDAKNPSVTPELMGGLTVPAGFFGAGRGGNGAQPCAPVADNHQAYYDHADAAQVAYHHVVETAGHMDFTDDGGGLFGAFCDQGDDPAGTRADAAGMTVAFFRRHLEGEEGYASWLAGELVPASITWTSK